MKTYVGTVYETRVYRVRYTVEAEDVREAADLMREGSTVFEEDERFEEVIDRTIAGDSIEEEEA